MIAPMPAQRLLAALRPLASTAALLALVACSGSSKSSITPTTTPEVTVRAVPSEDTGPGITRAIGDNLVAIGPSDNLLGRLWLFLPGTGARPDQYSLLARRAAQLGFHSIHLAYINNQAVNSVCPGKEATCHEDMRREIITGEDTSPYTVVDPANSIVHRLVALLTYLDRLYPDEDWGRFLDAGRPRWDLITVGGQSQGAGHAAFIGKLYSVARVVMFSGTEPAPWTSVPGATPPDRYYAIAHQLEPIYTPITRSWQNLGIPGSPVSVDSGPAAYQGAHQLFSTYRDCRGDPASNGYYHNCESVDEYTPLLPDGTSLFQPVWDYLLSP
jgi:hypothetical protein